MRVPHKINSSSKFGWAECSYGVIAWLCELPHPSGAEDALTRTPTVTLLPVRLRLSFPQAVLKSFMSPIVHSELRMIPLKPSLVIQSPMAASSYVQAERFKKEPISSYPHISFFRSLLLDMQIYSPSVKVVKLSALEISQPRPVFCDQDKIEGKIKLDPSFQNGRLTISLEGAFEYSSVEDNPYDQYSHKPTVRKHRHVFLSSSATIPISSIPDSRSTIREALSRKRPSTLNLNSPASRTCEFSFELPRGSRTGEEMPSTFSSKTPPGDLQSRTEELEVAYRIMAVWEASDGSEPGAILEAPVLFQPDTDFQSFDGSAMEPKSWLEMPLIPERLVPFGCAVTLPRPQSFSRCGFVPYFVVFATNTRSPCLVKEIAADATITVSLIRKITITPQRTPQSPTPPDTPPSSDESDSQSSPFAPRSRLLRRSAKTPPRSHSQYKSLSGSKPLPELSQEVFSLSRTLETQLSIGFPKRPRANAASQNLPDGLYKGKVQLSKGMLPSMDWPGVTVKYYFDVSVLVGQDNVRARVPIKVY